MRTSTLPRLLSLMKPFAALMLLALVFGVLTIGSSVALMATSAWMLSKAALMPSIAELSVAPVLVRAFGVSRGVMRYLERLVSHDVTFRLLSHLRVQFYAALEPLAPAGLSRQRTGDLLARIIGDVDSLQNVYLRGIAPPLVAICVTLGTTALIGIFDGPSALMALAWFLVGMTLLPLLAWISGRRLGARRVALQAELSALTTERVQGMAELLIYGGGQRQQARVERLLDELAAHERQIARWDALHNALNVIVVQGAGLAVLFVALARVDGVLLATLALATVAAFEAITPLTPATHALSANLSAARRLFDLMDTPPAVTDTVTASATPRDGSLRIHDLTFRYPTSDGTRQPPVFEHLSLSIASGERVALLAPSGLGKSTLIHLLARFYDYEAGEILLGGHDLRAYTQTGARAAIAVMEQRPALFNTTLRENIRVGHPEASDADVEDAARRAEIHDFIQSLPQGYDTLVGEDGGQLSGGQRQRVALARALLRPAPILILDEPTAHLDPATAEAVLTTIFQQAGERTVILLAHQASPLLARLGVRCVPLTNE